FCKIHHAETTIVPDGIRKGYPTEINFELLEGRIIQMKDELLNIINKKIGSYYWNFSLEICAEVGSRKAGTPMILMNRFEKLRPGYYGSKGLNIIVDVLSELFLFKNILTYDLTHPKNPVDFLQEVLVPETALRLILQDKSNITLEEARKIMEDGGDFGDYVHGE
ncbi:RTC4-like domain-containing protein, partial [Glomus cerebriforme]